ncbi:CrcB protein [Paucidesulfovibrio gracilis DSM 16080]|uniref:Fluoride-specific ion channel FluC n=1 Tax=Paucidesulfovibrio gracilis DSM 16080 TaxID=1121449 RepID=A0A1T4WT36_9BACT|nr:fluoride efflux transporter CrcB [Paucidesulfovibrio gracilis]SKA80277.1 CrcB protein [Paucidesulfovibrio gracilis DSM 16080]
MNKIFVLALGGAAGTLSRYWLSGIAQRFFGASFPMGTFAVNMLGSLCFGLLWGLFENRVGFSPELRLLLLTGFMGAFTTFSTYMFESGALLRHGQYLSLLLNVGGQSLLGLTLVLLGMALGRLV